MGRKIEKESSIDNLEWLFLKIAISDKIPDGLMTVKNDYTLDDLMQVHEALDIVEALEKEAEEEAKRKNK